MNQQTPLPFRFYTTRARMISFRFNAVNSLFIILVAFALGLTPSSAVRAQHEIGSMQLEERAFTINWEVDSLRKRLAESRDWSAFSMEEQETLYWVNLVRLYPAEFRQRVLLPFLKQFPESVCAESRSLDALLQRLPARSFVAPDAALRRVALAHARDLSVNRKPLSHLGTRGQTFAQRMKDAGALRCAGENIYDGRKDPLLSLILLLIDRGVGNVGHRMTLLDPNFNALGLAYQPYLDADRFIMVQDFGCRQ